MLVIGHRGAAGLAHENTLEALRAGLESGADMLEFDVRMTKDGIPILAHDFHNLRTHRDFSIISRHTLAELHHRLHEVPIVTLEEVLDEFFGTILLNIEVKGRGTGKIVTELLKSQYIKSPSHWDNILLSSFHGYELRSIRKASKRANLALLHFDNPFLFIAYQRSLKLSAVGFHRLYINRFALEIAKRVNLFTYAYTVDRPHAAVLLAQQGVDGVVTNRPDKIIAELKQFSIR
ncbi:MAG TPA: glycerophosphodiester phosphodiesterase [Candidatus Saccharimonadales bacterium]|nr:glycerophosphodiester phosphodiesterase [Candidatus Saccharimonadales bacterium]